MAKGKASFGSDRKLPSGRFQARYTAPGGAVRTAPMTFETKGDAETWLSTVRADLVRGAWLPADADTTFGTYAKTWLAHRTLKPRTREHYQRLLDRSILPTFKNTPMRRISPTLVREWYATLNPQAPTERAHTYGLLKAICATAVSDELLPANPCRIRGAGQVKRATRTEPATLAELEIIASSVPDRYRLMILLSAWCGLRYGELIELRVKDVDRRAKVIRVRRACSWAGGKAVISTPKTAAGVRDVAIPPHLMAAVAEHLAAMTMTGKDALLFPAASDETAHMRPSTLTRIYYPARAKAGRSDLRFHDLRHTSAVLAASTGATLAELMARLGHSTPAAAMRYQHAAQGRDAQIAAKLSEIASAGGNA